MQTFLIIFGLWALSALSFTLGMAFQRMIGRRWKTGKGIGE